MSRYCLHLWRCLSVLLLSGVAAWAAEPSAAVSPCTEFAGPTRALGLFKPGVPVALEDGFRDPPPISRSQCWWQCFGSAFEKAEITRELEEFKAQGMGGVTIKDTLLMPRDEKTKHIRDLEYLGPEWLDMFAHVAAECKRLGLILRTRLGSGWNEGGPWVTPEMSSQVLAFAQSQPIAGPQKYVGPIPTAADGSPTEKTLRAGEAFVVAEAADGKRIDVTEKVSDGKLAWDMPAGTWTLVSCFSQPSGVKNVSTSPSGSGLHHDHLRTAAADLFMDHVGGRIATRLGDFADTAFDGFNTDSWELGTPTWTPGLRREFIARCGYDPVPYLPVLDHVRWKTKNHIHGEMDLTGAPTETDLRFLFDFRTVVSELIAEHAYRQVEQWCHARGVAYEAQAGGPLYVPKDMLRNQGGVDIPMGELWERGRSEVKIASSAAHAYGKRLAGAEVLTDTVFNAQHNHISTTPLAMKKRLDEVFLLGGNYLTQAVVEYSPREAGRPGWVHNCGPHLNHNQAWQPLARGFFDYLGRCCFLLQSGQNVAQAAVYQTFRPSRNDPRWHETNNDLTAWPKQFAFDYVGDDALQRMTVRDGQIALPSGATYEVLYVQPTPWPSMPLATLAKIRDLIRDGATVVWSAKPPASCPGLVNYPQCDEEFHAILKGLCDSGKLTVLPSPKLAELVPLVEKSAHPPLWRLANDAPLRFVHRRTADADIVFVVNRAGWDVDTPVTFRVHDRMPELWIPETGAIAPAVGEKTADGVRLSLKLTAFNSVFIVFRKAGQSLQPPVKPVKKAAAAVAIGGPWKVAFPAGSGAPESLTFPMLKSWTEMPAPNIRYFSGVATYRTTFTCPASVAKSPQATLYLGRVAEVCEVRLNGKLVGNAWHAPYRFPVGGCLVAGDNQLEIRVGNLWQNRLVGDAALPPEKRISRMTPETHYQKLRGFPLLESGLLGPVTVTVGD